MLYSVDCHYQVNHHSVALCTCLVKVISSPLPVYWSAHIDRKLASIVSCFFSLLTVTVSYTVIPYTPQQIKNAIFCHYQVNHYRVALYMCVGKTYLLFPACIYWSAHIDRKLASIVSWVVCTF